MKAIPIPSAKLMRVMLLAFGCIFAAQVSQAQSSFAGVLLAGNGSGIVAGTVQLSVNGGQITFQSTLYEPWVTNTTLATILEVQGNHICFDLGTGTPGTWPVQEFVGPLPGLSTAPAPSERFPGLEQMPGPQTLSAGRRFAGAFTAFPSLENALLTSGGKISLHVRGTVNGMENPTAVEVLVTTSPRISNQFAAILSATNEIPPHTSPYHGTGSFTLESNFLTYNLALDAGLRPTHVSIFGPASPPPNELALAADSPGNSGFVIYRGQINLTGAKVEELRRGELYVNVFTALHPHGELRGSILPIPIPVPNAPGIQPVISVSPK